MRWILKTGQFYTVSEKRLANLHFFSEKWPKMVLIFLKVTVNYPSSRTVVHAPIPKIPHTGKT